MLMLLIVESLKRSKLCPNIVLSNISMENNIFSMKLTVRKCSLLILCFVILCAVKLQFKINISSIQTNKKEFYEPILNQNNPSLEIPLVTILCSDSNDEQSYNESLAMMFSKERQLEQTRTMLGSLLYFSVSSKWRVIIFTNNDTFYNEFLKTLNTWPSIYLERLQLEKRMAKMPIKSYLLDYYRPCSWLKPFLPGLLPDLDSAVYIDTDVVFTSPLEDLWKTYSKFNDKQLIALGPEVWYLKEQERVYAGTAGVNTGVMLMNLTRMRDLPGDYSTLIMAEQYEMNHGIRHDQDLVNSYLHKNPQFLYEISYRWNFIFSYCSKWAVYCEECYQNGISIVHGADGYFYRKIDGQFSILYRALAETTIDMKIFPKRLLQKIEDQSEIIKHFHDDFSCSKYPEIPNLFLQHLKLLVLSEM